jgi:cysteine desulfurase
MRDVYLDHAATTPLEPDVLEAMHPYLTEHFGNASSVHAKGRRARVALDEARETVAGCIGAEASEVVFTSGGTEADNFALRGVLRRAQGAGGGGRLVTSAAEHKAVLEPAEALAEEGVSVSVLSPDERGVVLPQQVADALEDEKDGNGATLVSLMHTNNEVGTRTRLAEIADVCHARDALLHTDAVQAAPDLDVEALGVDLASLSAHKVYGPKGAGALYVRSGVELAPLVRGGSQERARRGGTENVAAVVGMAEALRRATDAAGERAKRLRRLQQDLAERLRTAFGEAARINTPLEADASAPHVLSVSFPPGEDESPLDGEMLLLNLDVEGVRASAGSACTSGALEPSHVLQAMGLQRETAAATVRFSFGKSTTESDVAHAADALETVVGRMRS